MTNNRDTSGAVITTSLRQGGNLPDWKQRGWLACSDWRGPKQSSVVTMFDRFLALLVRFYPAGFRRGYDEESMRLIRDRARDEKGILLRARLLVDLLWDLAVTVSHPGIWQHQSATSHHPIDGTLSWQLVNNEVPRAAALGTGALVSLVLLAVLAVSLSSADRAIHFAAWRDRQQPAPPSSGRRMAQAAPFSGQTNARQVAQLEDSVASIRPSKSGDRRRPAMEFLPGSRFKATNMPLFIVLATAYQIPFQSREAFEQRIKGIPDWMFTTPYDMEVIAASPAPADLSSTARNDRIRFMLQGVLVDRLKLRLHREAAEMPIYALMIGSRGIKLESAKIAVQDCAEAAPFGSLDLGTPACHQFLGGRGRGLRGAAVDMADFAAALSNWSELPVIDQTGLSGLYQIQTEGWGSSGNPSERSLDEIVDKLGLKLVRKKARLDVHSVEHVERPSEN